MVAIQAGLIGPQADGTTPRQNPLDVTRHMFWANQGGKSGIIKGFVPSVVAGQMQLSFTAGSAMVAERDGSQVELDRGYPVYSPSTAVVQFGAAHASLARNDCVVAAAVDVEDGAQGSGALGVGGHLVVVPGAAGSSAPRTDAEIAAYLGRGGFHRLYDVPIAAASTQINLAGASFRGFKINDWNLFTDIPFTLSMASGWSLQGAKYRYWALARRAAVHILLTRTGGDLPAGDSTTGNITDADMTTNFPSFLIPPNTGVDDAIFIIDRSTSAASANGVSFGRGRIDTSTSRLVLTSVLPGAVWQNNAPSKIDFEYSV